jgi:hypothetical protein
MARQSVEPKYRATASTRRSSARLRRLNASGRRVAGGKGWHMNLQDDGLRSSGYSRERAEEVRTKAEEMHSGDAQSAMLDIAAMYDRMAKRAAEREAKYRLD